MATNWMNSTSLLPGRTDQKNPKKGAAMLNTYFNNGAIFVRPGFGTLVQSNKNHTCLGSYTFINSFKHEINVSVVMTEDRYRVYLYNLTTNEYGHEDLFVSTAQSSGSLLSLYGAYVDSTDNNSALLLRPRESEWFFCEYNGNLILGSELAGVFFLSSAPCFNMSLNIEDSTDLTNQVGRAESSVITPIVFNDGILSSAYAYRSFLPPIRSATVINNRVVYATKDELYFSDVGFPANVVGNNYISLGNVECQAVRTLGQSVAVLCKNQVMQYTPSIGSDLASQGILTVAYESIGTVGANSCLKIEDNLFVLGDKSAFMFGPGFTVTDIGQNIAAFFEDQLANPVSVYPTSLGDVVQPGLTTWWSLAQESGYISTAYNPLHKYILVTFPSQKMSLCYSLQAGAWSVWTYEFCSQDAADKNIVNPFITSTGNRVILAAEGCVLELGRGGALDRNIRWEYYPEADGEWTTTTGTHDGYVVLGKPIKVKEGYTFPGSTTEANDDTYLVPVSVRAPGDVSLGGISVIEFTIGFDGTNYRPIWKTPSGTECAVIYPSQRIRTIDGFTWQTVGSTIAVRFDGADPSAYTEQPYIECVRGGESLLGYLPIKALNTSDHTSMGLTVTGASLVDSSAGTLSIGSVVWNQEMFGSAGATLTANRTQAVMWCILSDMLESNGFNISKVSVQFNSAGEAEGNGTDPNPSSDYRGILNSALFVDGRAYNAQVVDWNNTRPINSIVNGPLVSQVNRYGQGESASWGTMTYDGGYIVCDLFPQVTTRGLRVRAQNSAQVMLYGWMTDKANTLSFLGLGVDYTSSPARTRIR